MVVHFKATETTCDQVKPGQAFSTAGPEYWEHLDSRSIAERVCLRTDAPCPADDVGQPIYVIEIELQGEAR